MTFNFLLLFGQLNLLLLLKEKRKDIIKKTKLLVTKVVE